MKFKGSNIEESPTRLGSWVPSPAGSSHEHHLILNPGQVFFSHLNKTIAEQKFNTKKQLTLSRLLHIQIFTYFTHQTVKKTI
jgi:hypothetical protein